VIYEFKPVETTEYVWYLLGDSSYIKNFCWPGPTPVYSPLEKYPDNPVYAILISIFEIRNMLTTAFIGLDYNKKAMEGPIERSSWDEIY
jgi:hypothetical protein